MRRKLAFVVQRYGLEVNGGAELLVRQMAEHLVNRYDVEVITTKAQDYITWKDEYDKDIEEINGVTVRRFGVKKPRDIRKFGHISMLADFPFKFRVVENRWVEEQGPNCPKLITYLEEHKSEYDVFVFMTYLYYTTVKGLAKVKDKAILIPTAHDEPPIYMKVFKEVFTSPKGFFYCTPTEKNFVEQMFHNENIMNNDGFGGAGVELPDNVNRNWFKEQYREKLTKDSTREFTQIADGQIHYMVYAGRIDTHKGCAQLFDFFERFKEELDFNLKLVMMGKVVMDVPERDDIITLGFVSDEMKFNVMAAADFLIMPSQFESLSMVVLEALALGVPVVVNGLCEVLKAHCEIGHTGLYYTNYEEFRDCLTKMITEKKYHDEMGNNGLQYISKYYRWDVILDRFETMVESICKETGRK